MNRDIEISAWDGDRRYSLRFQDLGAGTPMVELSISELDGGTAQPVRSRSVLISRDAILRKLETGADPMIDSLVGRFLRDDGKPGWPIRSLDAPR